MKMSFLTAAILIVACGTILTLALTIQIGQPPRTSGKNEEHEQHEEHSGVERKYNPNYEPIGWDDLL